ncbi:MAG: hypothetical protein AAGK97_07820, partial [Bacteroidota bacterium]
MSIYTFDTVEPAKRKCIFARKTEKKASSMESVKFEIFNSISEIGAQWDEILNSKNIFLSSSYMSVMESCPPDDMK